LTSFEVSVLEETTTRNLWELSSAFLRHAFSIATPSKAQLLQLQEEFNDFPSATLTLHHELYRNGYVCSGDVVAFEHNGENCIGELLFTVGVTTNDDANLISFISKFEPHAEDDGTIECTIHEDRPLERIDSSKLQVALTYSMSIDRRSCVVICPPYR